MSNGDETRTMVNAKSNRLIERLHMRRSNLAGFTVIELVTSIAIIGILAAVTVPRMFDNSAFSERGYIDELASTLRYAQKVAIASECEVQVSITAAGYSAMQRAAAGNTCNPAGAWTTVVRRSDGTALAGNSPVDVTSAPVVTITLDRDGAPMGGAPPLLSVGPFALSVNAADGAVTVVP